MFLLSSFIRLLLANLRKVPEATPEPEPVDPRWLASCEKIECHWQYQRSPRKGPPLGTYSVIHYTAPPLWSAKKYAKALQKPNRKRRWSAHVIIDRDGHAVQCVPLDKEASHAGDGRINGRSANIGSWGIELVNSGWAVKPGMDVHEGRHQNPASKSTKWQRYTDAQMAKLNEVLAEMVERAPGLTLIGHEDVTNHQVLGKPGSKTDPGPAFDWDRAALGVRVGRLQWDFNSQSLQRPWKLSED